MSSSAVLHSGNRGQKLPWQGVAQTPYERLISRIEEDPVGVLDRLEQGASGLSRDELFDAIGTLARSFPHTAAALRVNVKDFGNRMFDTVMALEPTRSEFSIFLIHFSPFRTAVTASRVRAAAIKDKELLYEAVSAVSHKIGEDVSSYSEALQSVDEKNKERIGVRLVAGKCQNPGEILRALDPQEESTRIRILGQYVYCSGPTDPKKNKVSFEIVELFNIRSPAGREAAIKTLANNDPDTARICALRWGLHSKHLLRAEAGKVAYGESLADSLAQHLREHPKDRLRFVAYLARAAKTVEYKNDPPRTLALRAVRIRRWKIKSEKTFTSIARALDAIAAPESLRKRLGAKLAVCSPGVFFAVEAFGVRSEEDRLKLLQLSMNKGICPAPVFSLVQVSDPLRRLELAQQAFQRHPFCTTLYLDQFKLQDRQLVALLNPESSQDAFWVVHALSKSDASSSLPPAVRSSAAYSLAKRWDGHEVMSYELCGLVDSDFQRFRILSRCASANPAAYRPQRNYYMVPNFFARLKRHFGKGAFYKRMDERACASSIRHMAAARPWFVGRLLKNEARVRRLVARTVRQGRYENLVEIAKERLMRAGSPLTRSNTFNEYDRVLAIVQDCTASGGPYPLLKKMRDAGILPSRALAKSIQHFSTDDRSFLLSKVLSAGEAFGETLCQTLVAVFPAGTRLSPHDKKVIEAFVQSGFQGWSEKSFEAFRKTYTQSPVLAERLVQRWRLASKQLLDGEEIDERLLAGIGMPELIRNTYRPVSQSLSRIEHLVKTVEGHQDHLKGFRYPSQGYELVVGSAGEARLQEGAAFDVVTLARLVKTLRQCCNSQKLSVPEKELRLILNGNFKSAELLRVLSWVLSDSDKKKLDLALESCETLLRDSEDPEKALDLLGALEDILGVLAVEAIELRAEELGSSLTLTSKLAARVNAILSRARDSEVSVHELKIALSHQLAHYFDSYRRDVSKERKKYFRTRTGETKRFRLVLTKARHSFFSRSSAGLCTDADTYSWDSPKYVQMNLVDDSCARVVGNIQLHCFLDPEGAPAVLGRINPSSKALLSVDNERLGLLMAAAVRRFAEQNRLVPYLPEQGEMIMLSNRPSLVPVLRRLYGTARGVRLKLTSHITCKKIYQLDTRRLDQALARTARGQ